MARGRKPDPMSMRCARCGHSRGLHDDPAVEPGPFRPEGCRARRICQCRWFFSAEEWVLVEDSDGVLWLRRLPLGASSPAS